ncbi:hypothetical protein BKA70DRAFT_1451077 [Coprinopsis sp. MPI-PUGE-AT-0042]|nr:hypothetical protein BKA70DRAFT_1451077 [Coprinopsis sp. MPI-PUGE-AT-0042]
MPLYRLASPAIPSMPRTQIRSSALLKPEHEHYIRRIQAAQIQTAYSPPEILHWDGGRSNLHAWSWPSHNETGERIAPSELEDHRRTHHFTAPCCLCAISMHEGYTESKIGLVLVAPGETRTDVNGEYVAQCALNKCGYFSKMALNVFMPGRYFKSRPYPKRVFPLISQELNYIHDLHSTFEASGLSHALPFSGIWSRGSRNLLKVEKPETGASACSQFTTLWARGVDEEIFWQMFVQCALCRVIMPKDIFASSHGPIGCRIEREGHAWPMDEDTWRSECNDVESLSGDTEIIDWDDVETDDEMPPLEPI